MLAMVLSVNKVRELYDGQTVLNDYRRLLDELKSIREESVTGIEASKPIPEQQIFPVAVQK